MEQLTILGRMHFYARGSNAICPKEGLTIVGGRVVALFHIDSQVQLR